MVREQIVSKGVEVLADLSRVVGEQLLDRDGPEALDAKVLFVDLLDRAASGAGHRDRNTRAVGADFLAAHEASQEHPARALATGLWSAHRVIAARAYPPSVKVRGNAARLSAETAGLDRSGVTGQAGAPDCWPPFVVVAIRICGSQEI